MKEPWWWLYCSWFWRENDDKANPTITSHPLLHNYQHHAIYLKGNLYAKVLNLKLGQSPVASSALEQHGHLEMNAVKISKSRTQNLNYNTGRFIEQKKSEIFVIIEIFMWQQRIPKVRWSVFHSRRRNVGLCSRFAPWFKDIVNEWHFTKLFIIIFIITITIVSIITIIIVRSLTSWMLSTSSSSSSGESLLPEIPPVAASFRTIRSIDLPS